MVALILWHLQLRLLNLCTFGAKSTMKQDGACHFRTCWAEVASISLAIEMNDSSNL